MRDGPRFPFLVGDQAWTREVRPLELLFPDPTPPVLDAADEAGPLVAAVRSVLEGELGDGLELEVRSVMVGRGWDAVDILLSIGGAALTVFYGGARLHKEHRAAVEEWQRIARDLGLPERWRRVLARLRDLHRPVSAISLEIGALLALDYVDDRAGARARLVWWDEVALSPMEWGGHEESITSSAERLYYFVLDAADGRWFLAMKGDGTITDQVRAWRPRSWDEYGMWQPIDRPDMPEDVLG